jgi:excisionase family DNA binding protein
MTAGSRLFVVELDRPAQAQLATLLGLLEREARANGARPSPVLLALGDTLRADRGGQEGTTYPDGFDLVDDDDMAVLAVTYEVAGRQLGVSERTIRRLVSDGALQAVYVGSRTPRVPVEELRRYIGEQMGTT